MRRGLLIFVVGLWLAGCDALRPKSADTEPAPLGQKVVITDSLLLHGGTDTLRLGRMFSGEEAVVHFHLENRSHEPLLIVGEELTCGCIALTYERKPVSEGESVPVEMHFSSRGLYGWQLKLFYLHLHGSAEPLKFFVEAEVE